MNTSNRCVISSSDFDPPIAQPCDWRAGHQGGKSSCSRREMIIVSASRLQLLFASLAVVIIIEAWIPGHHDFFVMNIPCLVRELMDFVSAFYRLKTGTSIGLFRTNLWRLVDHLRSAWRLFSFKLFQFGLTMHKL